jgi:hypothetical protein
MIAPSIAKSCREVGVSMGRFSGQFDYYCCRLALSRLEVCQNGPFIIDEEVAVVMANVKVKARQCASSRYPLGQGLQVRPNIRSRHPQGAPRTPCRSMRTGIV